MVILGAQLILPVYQADPSNRGFMIIYSSEGIQQYPETWYVDCMAHPWVWRSAEECWVSRNSPLWARFDLFSKDEYTSWHDKYRHDKISSKVLKKQDAIFGDFFWIFRPRSTEIEKCIKNRSIFRANPDWEVALCPPGVPAAGKEKLLLLVTTFSANCSSKSVTKFAFQGYRNRLLQENILVEADVDRLIPDVLDALLVFHLNMLERLTVRQRESDEVETISDILAEEVNGGRNLEKPTEKS